MFRPDCSVLLMFRNIFSFPAHETWDDVLR